MGWPEIKNNILRIYNKEKGALVLLLIILSLGNYLRWHNYAVVPHPGETADEYAFAWAGLSLIEDKVPESWSGVNTATAGKSAYSNIRYEKINIDGIYDLDSSRPEFSMAKPWFDKPPGFALLVGGFSYSKGLREYIQTSIGIIRRIMPRIALITTILIFLLGTRLYGKWTGLFAALLYSIVPTFVISSRLVLAENGYIPLFLGAVIISDYYVKSRKMIYLIIAAVLAAVGITFKLSAVSILITLIMIYLYVLKGKERVRAVAFTVIVGSLGFFVFILYGAYYDWNTFWKVFQSQSDLVYGAGSQVFYSAVVSSKITSNKFFTDGWVTLGWLSLLLLGIDEWRKERGGMILLISLFSYFIIYIIFGSEAYGWYRFPFFPFLAIATARVFTKIYKESNVFASTLLFLLPFGTIIHQIYGVLGFQMFVPFFRGFAVVALAIYFLGIIHKYINVQRLYMLLLFLTLIILSIKLVLYFNYDNWFYVT